MSAEDDRPWDWDLADRFMAGESIAEASTRTGVLAKFVERALRDRLVDWRWPLMVAEAPDFKPRRATAAEVAEKRRAKAVKP